MQRHNGFAAQKKKKKIVRVRLELPTLMLSARNAKKKREVLLVKLELTTFT